MSDFPEGSTSQEYKSNAFYAWNHNKLLSGFLQIPIKTQATCSEPEVPVKSVSFFPQCLDFIFVANEYHSSTISSMLNSQKDDANVTDFLAGGTEL